ncbi:S26 type I signal peptidase [Ordospora colligata]|uniref:Signal peptidase complex catalytic subunit SEC11 n=1 Tax=Ordospora colligata OC4 TaxID=1354746 RepID=A0A0B2UMI8_9MICR|nr:S26 type I signal peptidase [Ordospora colligata OC4]KHN70180.1 S26 type I signal peptidase [Ordospora colligata OC4]TBU16724.1 S26 type I signal peptidase [Ordospora colligata]TBU17030.1 S26 type I signal peptidase [Ordospora colligata]TBU19454.1 S26 type I signal peptidase [Ordospora colligata]
MLECFVSQKDLQQLKRMGIRQMLIQFVNAAYSISGTYMIWKLISVLLNNDSPIVVVLSESMAPGFERGDILWLAERKFGVGDMAVFKFNNEDIPCVHRCIKQFGERYLTKGDNNMSDDVSLYPRGRNYLRPDEIKSIVVGYVPYFGWLNLWITRIPGVKALAFLILSLPVLLIREE